MIIDLHTHIFPDRIAPAALEKLRSASHTRPFTDGTAGGLSQSMKEAGIDLSVVLPVATNPRQVPHVNDAAVHTHETRRETGIDSFGALHPDFEGWEEEMERLAAGGIRGIKLHPPYQGVDFDDPRYLRILKKAAELSMPVLIHAGLDVGLPGARQATPEKVRQAVDAVPGVTLILAHMGGWRCWEDVLRLLPDTPVLLDTSFALGDMTPDDGQEITLQDLRMLSPAKFMDLSHAFGPHRLLFGTDCPWSDQKKYLSLFSSLPFTEEEKKMILGENAKKILKMA